MVRLLAITFLLSVSNFCWSDCIRGDCRNGSGTYIYPDGGKYVRQFKDGKRNGQGTSAYAGGAKYVGEFRDDKRNGQGTLTFPDGKKYVGEYKDDKFDGPGTYSWPGGGHYVGTWKDGEKENGREIVIYDGTTSRLTLRNGEVINQEVLSGQEVSQIVEEQMAKAYTLLFDKGYDVGMVSNLPNPLLISTINAFCEGHVKYQASCPDVTKVQLQFSDFLLDLQTLVVNKVETETVFERPPEV